MVVFFDLDDTLIDHTAAIRSAVAALHAKLRLGTPMEDFLESWRGAHDRHYPRYLGGELTYEALRRLRIRETVSSDLDDHEADGLFQDYMDAYQSAWTLFPDVLPCLNDLRNCPIGLISNGPSNEQRKKLTRLAIADRFEHILISEECGCAKPDARIFRDACRAAGVAPSEALHIGDHYEIDVCGANGAGLRGIWLDRSGRTDDPLETNVLHSLNEFRKVAPTNG